MNKNFRLLVLHFWAWMCLLSAGILQAQPQNTKIIFPHPSGFSESAGEHIIPVSDGGYLLLGNVTRSGANTYQVLPRAIKLDAALQVEWDNFYLAASQPYVVATPGSAPLELPDGSFVFAVQDSTSNFDLIRVSDAGAFQWGADFPGFFSYAEPMSVLPTGEIFLMHCRFDNVSSCGVLHLDMNGNEVLYQPVPALSNIVSSTSFPNGDALTTHFSQNKIVFTRINPQGQVLWQSLPQTNLLSTIATAPDGSFGGVGRDGNSAYFVRFFDAAGQTTGQTPVLNLPIWNVSRLDFYEDGSFLISGSTTTQRAFMARCQRDGAITWSAESPADGQQHLYTAGGLATPDGWGVAVGTGVQFSMAAWQVAENSGIAVNVLSGRVGRDANNDCAVQADEPTLQYQRVRATDGVQEFFAFTGSTGHYEMHLPPGNFTLSVNPNEPFFILCPDEDWTVNFPVGPGSNVTLDLPMQSAELIHLLSGYVKLDQNDNCTSEAGDTPLENWWVKVRFNGQTVSTRTDATGYYQFFLPSGEYEVEVTPYNHLFDICAPTAQMVVFSGADPQSAVADFTATSDNDCAYMRVRVGNGGVRPCVNVVLPVHYWNEGVRTAENVSVEVTLPPGLEYVRSEPAPAAVDGNVLRFEFDEVPASPGGVSNVIFITVSPDCDLQIGDQVCLSAQITPSQICGDSPDWDGAVTSLSAECVGDSAVFKIRNIGTAQHSVQRNFRIVEDQIVLLQGTFQLDPLAEDRYAIFIENDSISSLTMIADQEPGFPGDPEVSITLSNCTSVSSNPSGFGGDPGPFSASACLLVRNSYDPNDKLAFPIGVGEEQVIRPGTPIDYTIRFQNTGNDTAFVVVLRDTLSEHFDYTKVTPIGASHRFEFAQLGEGNILHFHFPGINLPDSTTNLAGSQGFVQFRVYPKAGLPSGTVVDNSAAIYFDFNPPIITNTVSRKYQEFMLVQTVEPKQSDFLAVRIFPNPFLERAVLALPDDAPDGEYRLHLFDATGRLLQTEVFRERQVEINGEALPTGAMFWTVSSQGRIVASGKVVR